MNKVNSKTYLPIIVAVLVLIIMTVGSAYAYFSITVKDNSGTTKIDFKLDAVGSSSLISGKNLAINLTREQMMKQANDVTYYATEGGTAQTTANSVAIATATVTGEGTMNCNYTLNVNITGDMYTKLKAMSNNGGQAILNFAGVDYDLATTDFTNGLSGTLTNVSSSSSKDIMSSFRVINKKELNQNDLIGTDMTMTFTVKSFVCQIAS